MDGNRKEECLDGVPRKELIDMLNREQAKKVYARKKKAIAEMPLTISEGSGCSGKEEISPMPLKLGTPLNVLFSEAYKGHLILGKPVGIPDFGRGILPPKEKKNFCKLSPMHTEAETAE